VVESIIERQKIIETSDLDYSPLCIFPEGTVNNGENLSRFRRGAFAANMAIEPRILKYGYKSVAAQYVGI